MISKRTTAAVLAIVLALTALGATSSLVLEEDIAGTVNATATNAIRASGIDITGDQDAAFATVGEDGDSFNASVELNDGDTTSAHVNVSNHAVDSLGVEVTIGIPADVSVTNVTVVGGGLTQPPVQSQDDVWTFEIEGAGGPNAANTAEIEFEFTVADGADPGPRDITFEFRPVSVEE